MAEPTFRIEMLLGIVESRAWFAPGPDGTMVGMGQRIVYHDDGRVERSEPEPTGVVIRYG